MTGLVSYLLLFVAVGIFFVFFHLMLGRLVRPIKPDPEKLTIYECGEPTIGSAWIQFDLRFYVVALLFVIFDVEVAFFFPWAVVFGKAATLARPDLPVAERTIMAYQIRLDPALAMREDEPAKTQFHEAAQGLAWLAFWDIVVFFGVLLVGFAYLWRRGDLNWVRSTAAEVVPSASAGERAPVTATSEILVGAGPR